MNANAETYDQLFLYWIKERYAIYERRVRDMEPKPWSDDWIFQQTYFCNVHRENDRVTRWIRENWSMEKLGAENYEYFMVLARFLNWPDTLASMTIPWAMDFGWLERYLEERAKIGKVWGNAYVITSHGMPMPKATYLCQHLLPDVYRALHTLKTPGAWGSCGGMASALQRITGIGSFLAGQIVADLKNTKEHPLYNAPDKKEFVVPGPGSIRGLNWWYAGSEKGPVNERNFSRYFSVQGPRQQVDTYFENDPSMPYIDGQDLQNCLCEFDKYCRVRTGTGRSKRKYPGSV
jgi:hypothetical protein